MNFLQFEYLATLVLIPIFIGITVYTRQQQKQALDQFIHTSLWKRVVFQGHSSYYRFQLSLAMLGLIFGIVALAQPRWGFEWQEVQQKGTDIIIALDVSQSMLAEDVSPNRLIRAKREIIDFLQIVEGDRIGLIAFAGTSFLQSPLTLDYRAVEIFLDALDTDLIPVQGTAIHRAIDTAIEAFQRTPRESRALLLITDGEDHSGKLPTLIEKSKAEGIKIFVVGIGNAEGAPIPLQGSFLKNQNGEVVLSRLRESQLQEIALGTGGGYVRSVTGDLDLERIYYSFIKPDVEAKSLDEKYRKLWNEQFQYFIAFTLLCWLIEPWLQPKIKRITDLK